jgi:methyl-accepting chemotaxis protein
MAFYRSTFLINKKFQLRFSFYICSWLVALCIVYPMIISNLFDHFISYMGMDPLGPTSLNLVRARKNLLSLLVLMQVIMTNITFIISIFMSHRIAGPLYKLMHFFQDVKAGNLEKKLIFRKSDYFQDIAVGYNEMMSSIRGRIERNGKGVQTAIPILEKAFMHATPEVRAEIENALDALRESQKS